ncbi:Stk1 family PASTA domain-containing Ser/Thr kinase, partial [Streptomyces boluensis]
APAPTPAPGYGYPQQGGYQTPAPANFAPQQGGPGTPPPYNLHPQQANTAAGRPAGGKSNTPVIVGSIAAAVLAIGGLITAISMNGDDPKPKAKETPATEEVAGHKGPDKTKTIELTDCTDPRESFSDPSKRTLPSFEYRYIDSVKECIQKGGWKYKIITTDENTYGEGTVMKQYPEPDSDFDPDSPPTIQLEVSTGDPAQ